MNTTGSSQDVGYAAHNVEHPVSSALLDIPIDKAESNAEAGIAGGLLSGVGITAAGIFAGGAPAVLTASVASYILAVIMDRRDNSEQTRSFANGLKVSGQLGTAISGGLMLEISNFWMHLVTIVGYIFASNALYYMLTGKGEKAKEILREKMGEKEAEKTILRLQSTVKDNAKAA